MQACMDGAVIPGIAWPLHLQLNDRLSFGQHWVWKQMAVKWSGARPGGRVLDVCCGSGDLAFLLARAVGRKGEVGQGRLPRCRFGV